MIACNVSDETLFHSLSSIHTKWQRQCWRSERVLLFFNGNIFRQANADVDAGKWIPDPFQASTLTLTLGDASVFHDKQICQILSELTEIKCMFSQILQSKFYWKRLIRVTNLSCNVSKSMFIMYKSRVEMHFQICQIYQNLTELLVMKNSNKGCRASATRS